MLNCSRYYSRVYGLLMLAAIFLLQVSGCKKSLNVPNQNPNPSGKPNIVLILADDVGYEIPQYTGGQSYSTPNIDLLASSGMQFSECHSSPVCSPSRFMLLTGKYNFRNYTQWGVMDQSQRTIANMLHDAGYATCAVGKWQLDGGDASIRTFGFDSYCVWDPFANIVPGVQYKDPLLYENGSNLPFDVVQGKYGEDIIGDYAYNFMKNNTKKPFFLYYAMNLCHQAFSPTPDDPQFATWTNGHPVPSDTMYFKSMVQYMDKKVGLLVQEVSALGIAGNTIIIYTGDNGTDEKIYSLYKDTLVEGGKWRSTEGGTHVPLIVYWPGKVMPGTVSDNLIDFTDFMPTVADIAGVQVPASFGTMDGTSFYPEITGQPGTPRQWVYCYYNPFVKNQPLPTKEWAQDKNYKLYSTGPFYQSGNLYNYPNDLSEMYALDPSRLTDSITQIKNMLQGVINKLR